MTQQPTIICVLEMLQNSQNRNDQATDNKQKIKTMKMTTLRWLLFAGAAFRQIVPYAYAMVCVMWLFV